MDNLFEYYGDLGNILENIEEILDNIDTNKSNEEVDRQAIDDLTREYGDENIAKLIMLGAVWLGQTEEQLLLAKGKPKSVVRRTVNGVCRETWAYKGEKIVLSNDGTPKRVVEWRVS